MTSAHYYFERHIVKQRVELGGRCEAWNKVGYTHGPSGGAEDHRDAPPGIVETKWQKFEGYYDFNFILG